MTGVAPEDETAATPTETPEAPAEFAGETAGQGLDGSVQSRTVVLRRADGGSLFVGVPRPSHPCFPLPVPTRPPQIVRKRLNRPLTLAEKVSTPKG